jgi:exodeoxyribonuclease VII small subunit
MTQKTFKEAYGTLQNHAQTLRDQQEPNIDDLLNIVTESVAAYKVCQTRIDAVEKALEKALSSARQDVSDSDSENPV